jgi:hypothetical protein
VCVQFIVSVKALSAKSTLWVSLEAALVNRTWVIVAKLLVFLQFRVCKELVFVREDLLIPRTKITISG